MGAQDSEFTSGSFEPVSGSEFGRILDAVRELQSGQDKILQRLTALEVQVQNEDKRTDLFWSKDWAPMVDQMRRMEGEIQLLSRAAAKINGKPESNSARIADLEQFKWKAVGWVGGAGIVGGGLGSFIIDILMR